MHTHLFFTAFADQFKKEAGVTPLIHAGLGAAALYAGQKAHKDYKLGKKVRIQQQAMKAQQEQEGGEY